jgi:hypothetical protein
VDEQVAAAASDDAHPDASKALQGWWNPLASENRHLYATDTKYSKALEQYAN